MTNSGMGCARPVTDTLLEGRSVQETDSGFEEFALVIKMAFDSSLSVNKSFSGK